MNSLFFDDFEPGTVFESPAPREVADDTIRRFAELSGDMNPIHLDEEVARRTHGRRIAHGVLGLSIATGLAHELGIIRESVWAFGSMEWRFKAPVLPGDRLSLRLRVLRKRPIGKERGLVVLEASLLNQKGLAAQEGTWSVVVRRRA